MQGAAHCAVGNRPPRDFWQVESALFAPEVLQGGGDGFDAKNIAAVAVDVGDGELWAAEQETREDGGNEVPQHLKAMKTIAGDVLEVADSHVLAPIEVLEAAPRGMDFPHEEVAIQLSVDGIEIPVGRPIRGRACGIGGDVGGNVDETLLRNSFHREAIEECLGLFLFEVSEACIQKLPDGGAIGGPIELGGIHADTVRSRDRSLAERTGR